MKMIINLILLLLILFLSYMLYANIKEPINFNNEKLEREDAVIAKLKEIRNCQDIYRDIVGGYASDFDTLKQVLTTGQIKFVNVEGDPDSDEGFVETITYTPAIDSINAMKINLDSLSYVPFSANGAQFSIDADTLTYQQTLVNVLEVGTRYESFMGSYAHPKYSKYDNSYDPKKMVKFGNMNAPNTTGNWER